MVDRKQRLAKVLARAGNAIQFNEHLAHDGPAVFEHACRLGLEGIVSKRLDSPYRSGPSKTWLKSKNPLSEARPCGAKARKTGIRDRHNSHRVSLPARHRIGGGSGSLTRLNNYFLVARRFSRSGAPCA